MALSWIITGSIQSGLQIGLADVSSKMILYYFHERLWFRSKVSNARKRHLYKTITWRIIGTADTIVVSLWILGNGAQSFQIGGAETVTKTVLYYWHERLWYKLSFGLKKFREQRKSK